MVDHPTGNRDIQTVIMAELAVENLLLSQLAVENYKSALKQELQETFLCKVQKQIQQSTCGIIVNIGQLCVCEMTLSPFYRCGN